jgi:hypothetical protein
VRPGSSGKGRGGLVLRPCRGRWGESGGVARARAGAPAADSGRARQGLASVGEAGVWMGEKHGMCGPTAGPVVLGWPDEQHPL